MTEAPNNRSEKAENGPEFELRDGSLRAAVWKAHGEYGPIYNTKVSRYYRNDDGDMRETSSLRERDLLPASELTAEVHRNIRDRKRDHAQERQQSAPKQEQWHDEEKTRGDIKRDRFKKDRSQDGSSSRRRRNTKER